MNANDWTAIGTCVTGFSTLGVLIEYLRRTFVGWIEKRADNRTGQTVPELVKTELEKERSGEVELSMKVEYLVLGKGVVAVPDATGTRQMSLYEALSPSDPIKPIAQIEQILNALGEKGWDVITLAYPYIFKRTKDGEGALNTIAVLDCGHVQAHSGWPNEEERKHPKEVVRMHCPSCKMERIVTDVQVTGSA